MAQIDDFMAMQQADPTGIVPPQAGSQGVNEMGMGPGGAEAIAYLREHPEIMAQLQEDMDYADLLRNTESPQGRDSGRVYTAANPLEFVAQMMKAKYGGDEARRVKGARKDARGNLVNAAETAARVGYEKEEKQNAMLMAYIQSQMPPELPMGGPAMGGPAAPGGANAAINMAAGGGLNGAPAMTPQQPPMQPQMGGMSPEEMAILGPNPAGHAASQMLNPPPGPPPGINPSVQQPGWFDQNPARGGMQERLEKLLNWQGLAGDRSVNRPQGPPMGPQRDTPRWNPRSVPYMWPDGPRSAGM